MDFLYRERGAGKRTVKPSKDSEHLEAILGEESDDSDFEVEKHKATDESGADSEASDGSAASDRSDQEEDTEDEDEEEDDLLELRKNLSTQEIVELARRHKSQGLSSSSSSQPTNIKVCGACLGTHSDDRNEIVECDSCGISVHEACYGIQESGSIASTLSDASTEPWFCEPCRANIVDPTCQVCPNTGGIYKETDVGTWIHLVCALYTPNISFFDPERITRATLFEMNYQNWGRRSCMLCKEEKLARTGVCVECDAGMCKSFFHVTCAQEQGLLSEPKEDDHESYFAHCRMHSDKETMRRRKRNWLTHLLQYKERAVHIRRDFSNLDFSAVEESSVKRILRKLRYQQAKWSVSRARPAWIPTQKLPRSLLTSSSAVRKLTRKIELQGWDGEALEEAEKNREIIADINKRWGVNPAWNVEYVAYYHDRNNRILTMQESLASTVLTNNELTDTQTVIREQYSTLVQEEEDVNLLNKELKEKFKLYQEFLTRLDPLKRNIPEINSSKKESKTTPGGRKTGLDRKQAKPGKPSTVISSPTLGLNSCKLCGKNKDQHLLAHCDVCRFHYHLGCMSPPLLKMPKKTKQYGWQCSECDKDPSEPFAYEIQNIDVEAPRASRKRRGNFPSGAESDVEIVSPPPPSLKSPPSKKARELNSSSHKKQSNTKPKVCLPSITDRNSSDTSAATSRDLNAEVDDDEIQIIETISSPPLPSASRVPPTTPLSNRSAPPLVSPEPCSPGSRGGRGRIEKRTTRRSEQKTRADNISIKVSEPTDAVLLNGDEPPLNNGLGPSLPPKKLFTSKPTVKELPEHIEKREFKDWLGKKLSPEKTHRNIVNGLKDLSDEVSSDINAEVNPSFISVRLQDSPSFSGSEASGRTPEESDAKRERKRQKKEERVKRREEKRKLKALMSVNIVSDDPDIEENDDSCVIRIAPKPIKIKIKMPPADPQTPNLSSAYMHPKKKMVQMDSLANVHVVNGGGHFEPSGEPLVQSELRGVESLNQSENRSSQSAHLAARTDLSFPPDFDQSESSVSGVQSEHSWGTNENGEGRSRRSRTPGTVKKGRDKRTKCDVCLGEGDNSNLVRCDECAKCYHFSCLNPPVKKTPKVVGWGWSCSDCAPSDVDKSWHL